MAEQPESLEDIEDASVQRIVDRARAAAELPTAKHVALYTDLLRELQDELDADPAAAPSPPTPRPRPSGL